MELKNKVCFRSEVVGNDTSSACKEVDSYTISAGYDGDGNVARPATYVTHCVLHTSRTPRMSLVLELP